AQEHVRPDPVFQVMVDGPQVDVFGFLRPEIRFQVPEVFIGLDGLAAAEFISGGRSADDVDSVQRRLRADFFLIAPEFQLAVCDAGDEVLADLAFIDDLADLVGVFQPARLNRRPDSVQFFLGGGQQGFALGGALRGQRGIAAADQPLAGVAGIADLGEVLVIEQRHLQRPVVAGQGGDGGGAQGGDPARAGQRLELADPHLGDRSAVADQDDLIEPEFVAYDGDDFPECDRVGGIAREYPDRDRDPGPAGDHAELDLLAVLLPVP